MRNAALRGSSSAGSSPDVESAPPAYSARELFDIIDTDASGELDEDEMARLLESLEIDVSDEDRGILFRGLDADGGGTISFDEFNAWYTSSLADYAQSSATEDLPGLLTSLSEVTRFKGDSVPDSLVRDAIACATCAPNNFHVGDTYPWRFRSLGPLTVSAIADLGNRKARKEYSAVPGWMLVTSQRAVSTYEVARREEEEDYATTCCAIQNFMLSLWSAGVGAQWRTDVEFSGDEFASACNFEPMRERVVGVIWYGYPLVQESVGVERIRRAFDDVEACLETLP